MPDSDPRAGTPFASENPYQSPTAYGDRADVVSAQVSPNDPEHLRRVAIYQKGVLFAVAIYLINIVISAVNAMTGWLPPPVLGIPFALFTLVAFVGGIVAVGLLSARLHGVLIGVILAICTFVPCVNLIVLFVVNQQANGLLTSNGIRVGLFGAKMADIRGQAVVRSQLPS